jgi:hypothetical protein
MRAGREFSDDTNWRAVNVFTRGRRLRHCGHGYGKNQRHADCYVNKLLHLHLPISLIAAKSAIAVAG